MTYRESWVDAGAESCLALLTIPASSICNVERQYNSIALFQKHYTRANFFNDTHVLVAEDKSTSTFSCSTALVHVQVRTTNTRRSHLDDTIIWMLDLRNLSLFDGHLEWAVIEQSFHLSVAHLYGVFGRLFLYF
jgi:hypothetical protein